MTTLKMVLYLLVGACAANGCGEMACDGLLVDCEDGGCYGIDRNGWCDRGRKEGLGC